LKTHHNNNNNNNSSMNHHEDANQHPSSLSAPAADANLTNLQERCMQSIVSNWDQLNLDEDDAPTMQLLYQQSPLFLARLFCRTVSTAAQAVAATSKTTTSNNNNNSNSRRIGLRHGSNRPTLDEHLEILLHASDSSTSSSDDDSILFDESSFSSNSSDSS
jgi:hypothetical protein